MGRTRHKERSYAVKSGKRAKEEQGFQPQLKKILVHYDIIILFFFIFFCYNTVSVVTMSGDTIPAAVLPLALINDHSVFLDGPYLHGLVLDNIHSPDVEYAFPEINGHTVSFFPIITPILITPLYAFFSFLCWILNVPVTLALVGTFAKTSASCIAAASCVLVYLTAKELFSKKTALITTGVYAFATSAWSVSSQALWQHGTVQLLLILLIYCIVRDNRHHSPWTIVVMGIASGLFLFNRPPDALLLIPVIIYIVNEWRSRAVYYAAGCGIGGLPFLIYNILIFGNVFGGYIKNTELFHFGPDAIFAFISSLVAPNTGLLVFSPVLVFAIYGYFRLDSLKKPVIRNLLYLFGPAIILDIVVYSLFGLWSSVTSFAFGQRFLSGFIPVLALYLGVVIEDIFNSERKDTAIHIVQACFILLVLISVFIQSIGVFLYPYNPVKSIDSSQVWDVDQMIIVNSYNYGIRNITSISMVNIPPFPQLFRIPIHSQLQLSSSPG
jgi:4-amino-4-deoxy-L-arabinose transferase-like glycosyltransferase